MRGEDRLKRPRQRWRGGSPPHARGRPVAIMLYRRAGGITPACAGKTLCWKRTFRITRDHPRMRGEDGDD